MAKSNSQRQAEYRARRKAKRLCAWLGCDGKPRKYAYCPFHREWVAELARESMAEKRHGERLQRELVTHEVSRRNLAAWRKWPTREYAESVLGPLGYFAPIGRALPPLPTRTYEAYSDDIDVRARYCQKALPAPSEEDLPRYDISRRPVVVIGPV